MKKVVINILVNRNPYVSDKEIEIPDNFSQEKAIYNYLSEFSKITDIPIKLLSYEIANPFAEQQNKALNSIHGDILTSINEGQSDLDYYQIQLKDGVLTMDIGDGYKASIRSKDIIITKTS